MGRGLRLRLGGGGARGFLQPASERGGLAPNLPPGILPGSVSCTPFHPPGQDTQVTWALALGVV